MTLLTHTKLTCSYCGGPRGYGDSRCGKCGGSRPRKISSLQATSLTCAKRRREKSAPVPRNRRTENPRHDFNWPRVPDKVLAERQAALDAARTVTATLCGDPLPGRSAMDRRGEAQ